MFLLVYLLTGDTDDEEEEDYQSDQKAIQIWLPGDVPEHYKQYIRERSALELVLFIPRAVENKKYSFLETDYFFNCIVEDIPIPPGRLLLRYSWQGGN